MTGFRVYLKRWVQSILGLSPLEARLARLEASINAQAVILGRLATWQRAGEPAERIADWEFKVFSQWGEDGILQALIRRVAISRPVFVEFGVESYQEANSRFLLMKDHWSGLVMDNSEECVKTIRSSEFYWRYDLQAKCAFITRENINELLRTAGMNGDIGLLSIDIDGNDYWVWRELDQVSADIVVIEYNHRFGSSASVVVPYKPDFDRAAEHFSMIYYGASLAALCRLGTVKGYAFVGCNSAGNNAFFVKRDKLPADIPAISAEEGFVAGGFREARDEKGQLAYWTSGQELAILEQLPLEKV